MVECVLYMGRLAGWLVAVQYDPHPMFCLRVSCFAIDVVSAYRGLESEIALLRVDTTFIHLDHVPNDDDAQQRPVVHAQTMQCTAAIQTAEGTARHLLQRRLGRFKGRQSTGE